MEGEEDIKGAIVPSQRNFPSLRFTTRPPLRSTMPSILLFGATGEMGCTLPSLSSSQNIH
jgi:hypothetical protein